MKHVWRSEAERHASLKRLCYAFARRTEAQLKAEYRQPVPDLAKCRNYIEGIKWFREFDPADVRYLEASA
jgi:hypothetical protein